MSGGRVSPSRYVRGIFCVTQFVGQDESLHHALVLQCLLCRAIWDQLDALGLELVLPQDQNHKNHPPALEQQETTCTWQTFEVQARGDGLVQHDASVFESRQLVGWEDFFLSWKSATLCRGVMQPLAESRPRSLCGPHLPALVD